MDKLAMIDTLRERADISYEEAKEVLEQAGDDLLEAILLLEQQGKLKKDAGPEHSGASSEETSGSEADTEKTVPDEKDGSCAGSLGKTLKSAFRFVLHTSFHIRRRGREIAAMPTWVLAVLMPPFWGFIVPSMLIALFFEFRYSFSGKADVNAANEWFEKAGSFAEGVENGFQKDA